MSGPRWSLLKLLYGSGGIVCGGRRHFYSGSWLTSISRSRENWLTPAGGSSSPDQDILMKSIKHSKDTSDVLHYIGKHHSIMNRSHILQAFKMIFSIQKSESTSMSNGEVIKSGEFLSLCKVLKSRVRSLEINDTVDILKTLSYLGVPASSKLVSIMLNLIASRVNDLSLHQVMFLDFLLKDFSSTPIVEALRLALPIVFQANLNTKLDGDNVSEACDLLYYVTKKKLPVETVDSLFQIIMRHREEMGLSEATSVVRSLCDFGGTDESHRPLLHYALDIVLDNIDECSFSDLDVLLSKCVSKYSKETNYYFYHPEFVSRVSRFIVENDCGFEEGIWTLRKLNKVGHVDTALLDYLCLRADAFLENCKGTRSNILFTLIKGLSIASYKPTNWSSLEPKILSATLDMFTGVGDAPWFLYVRDLCSLGIWPLSILERIFSQSYLESYLQHYKSVLDHLQILSLYQEVSTLCPEPFTTSPPESFINNAIRINGKHVSVFPLLGPLERGLGGSCYVASRIYTSLGHFLHHVIVMRKGAYPVPISSSVNRCDDIVYLEDLRISKDHQKVAVLHLPDSFYCCNVHRLRGGVKQQLKSIEALGISVVPISASKWDQLLDHEKIPFLMKEIKEKCTEDSLTVSC